LIEIVWTCGAFACRQQGAGTQACGEIEVEGSRFMPSTTYSFQNLEGMCDEGNEKASTQERSGAGSRSLEASRFWETV